MRRRVKIHTITGTSGKPFHMVYCRTHGNLLLTPHKDVAEGTMAGHRRVHRAVLVDRIELAGFIVAAIMFVVLIADTVRRMWSW
jgi:hypothetical protein